MTSMLVQRCIAVVVATALVHTVLGTATADAEPAPPPLGYRLPSLTDTGGPLPTLGAGVSLAVGDFNGDDIDDVVVPTIGRPGTVMSLLGTGAGAFNPPTFTPLPGNGSLTAAAVAELDGDGRLDLVAATIDDGGPAITALLGRGDGTFDVAQRIVAAGSQIRQVAVGDVDGDGDLDFAAAEKSIEDGGVVQVARGRGDGTFRPPTSYTPDIYLSPGDLDLVDVDADGRPDLVYQQGCPTVRLNAGDGTFGDEICSTDPEGRIGGVAQVLADLDEDGVVDLATGDASGGHVTIALGDGAGRFTFFKEYDVKGFQVDWITAADFTGDGHLDLVAAADAQFSTPTRVIVQLRGSGNGTFPRRADYLTGGDGVAPIELNADGQVDLVSTGLTPRTVSGVLNGGRGRFRAPYAYKGETSFFQPSIVRSADVDGDGRADVVSVIFGTVYVRLMQENGQLGRRMASEGADRILSLALDDVDGDGHLDVVAGSFAPDNVYVLLGRGNGRFGPARTFGNGTGSAVLGVATGDVNGDGNRDLVSNTFGALAVSAGNGDGTFEPATLSGAGGGFQTATLLADFNDDGDLDAAAVVVVGSGDNARSRILVNEGHGDGTFSVGQQIEVDTNVNEAELADLGGDASPDLVLVGSGGTHTGRAGLFVLRNGDGVFAPAVFYGGPGRALTVADLNGDARPDVATVGTALLRLFTSRGDGTLLAAADLPAGLDAVDVAAVAIGGSRRVDVIELGSSSVEQIIQYIDDVR